jgi:hypothetical protein
MNLRIKTVVIIRIHIFSGSRSLITDLVWIRIEVKNSRTVETQNGAMEDYPGTMEAHNGGVEAHNKTMVADTHHFDDELSGSGYAFCSGCASK